MTISRLGATEMDGTVVRRRPRRLANPVVEEYVERIVSGELPPHSDLPKEAALCEQFQVSRSVIREALKVLEQKGLIEVQNGKGALTRERDAWNLLDPLVLSARVRHDADLRFLGDLVSVRGALEAEMAAHAASLVTEAQLEELRTIIDDLRSSMDDVARYVRNDLRFHDAVMRISGNELGRTIVLAILEKTHRYARYGSADLHHVAHSQPGHEAVFAALAAHDAAAAVAAVRAHIDGGTEPESTPQGGRRQSHASPRP